MFKLVLCLYLIPVTSFSQTIKYRQYKSGEVSTYKLTSEVYRNEKFSGKTVSIAQLKVVKDTEFFSEEISWLSKVSSTGKDTINFDSLARKVKPYKISLSPEGEVLLPKLTIPEVVGDITDLNTFFVAVAPALNIQKLSLKNKSFINDKPIQGNFADSIVILYGTDCIQVAQNLLAAAKDYVIVETKFTPPLSFCLDPLFDTITKKSFEQFNNIQMIQKSIDGKLNLLWGVENFTIITRINSKSGKILNARMNNFLNLRMRYNSSQDLKTYTIEMPVTIKRIVELELLK
jgi:hypothetical protein